MSLRLMKQQADPDGLPGHRERERIRRQIAAESNRPRTYNIQEEPEPVDFTKAKIYIDDIRDCPAWARGCHIAGCKLCKKREWELWCEIH